MNQVTRNNEIADVSVIIPVYNSGATLRKAIDSVLKQTLKAKEIIIIDDCSTELNTKEILNELSSQDHIYIYCLEENMGAGAARNVGWEKSTGKYIAFLDSDDVWHPEKLAIQYNHMVKNPDVIFSCHHMDVLYDKTKMDIKNNEKPPIILMNPIRYLFKHYPRGGTSFVMLLRDIPLRFCDNKRYSEDYLLWLEIVFNYKSVLLDIVMAYSLKERYGAGGLTKNLWVMEKGELDTFRELRQKKYISFILYCLVISFSICKFIYRWIICLLRK